MIFNDRAFVRYSQGTADETQEDTNKVSKKCNQAWNKTRTPNSVWGKFVEWTSTYLIRKTLIESIMRLMITNASTAAVL